MAASTLPLLPDAVRLLRLEHHSRRQGSGLKQAGLIGTWRLDQIWKRGSIEPASFSSALLRGLAARLRLAQVPDAEGLIVENSVCLGVIELRFQGQGRLQGRRPLLLFWFDRMQLRLAGRTLIERPIRRPDPKRLPFFALIASERVCDPDGAPTEAWLAARGRGGGLALWRLEP